MVVVRSLLSWLISGLSIGKFPLGSQTQSGEKLKGSVDRGVANLRVHPGDLGINLGEVFMTGGIEKDINDLGSLPGGL